MFWVSWEQSDTDLYSYDFKTFGEAIRCMIKVIGQGYTPDLVYEKA